MNGDGLNMRKPDYCPEWFDIARYDKLADFSREELSMILKSRQSSLQMFHEDIEHARTKGEFSRDEEEIREKYIADTVWFAASFIERTPEFRQEQAYLGNLNQEVNNVWFGHMNCRPMRVASNHIREASLYDIAALYARAYIKFDEMRSFFKESQKMLDECINLPDSEFNVGMDWLSVRELLPENTSKEMIDRIDCLLESTANQALPYSNLFYIDLNQNDKVLEAAFVEKLKEVRAAEAKRSRRISDAEIRKIVEYRVFAFIDLYLYSVFSGRKFTDWEMANMIYPPSHDTPPNFDAVDRIARTVRPKAMTLLKDTDHRLFL